MQLISIENQSKVRRKSRFFPPFPPWLFTYCTRSPIWSEALRHPRDIADKRCWLRRHACVIFTSHINLSIFLRLNRRKNIWQYNFQSVAGGVIPRPGTESKFTFFQVLVVYFWTFQPGPSDCPPFPILHGCNPHLIPSPEWRNWLRRVEVTGMPLRLSGSLVRPSWCLAEGRTDGQMGCAGRRTFLQK